MTVANFRLFCLIFVILLLLERSWELFIRRPSQEKGFIEHKWSLPVLIVTYIIILLFSVVELLTVSRKIRLDISGIGLLIFIFAFILRNWSVSALGKFHSTNIEIKPDHRLIKNGPYRYIRHPYYVSVMLEVMSIPLIINAFSSFCAVFIIYVPSVLMRVFLEERVLIRRFPVEYLSYKSDVMAFLPLRKKDK